MIIPATRELMITGGEEPCVECKAARRPNERIWGVKERLTGKYSKGDVEWTSNQERMVVEKVSLYEAQATYTAILLGPAPEMTIDTE